MRILVLGAGGVGGYFGAKLARAGVEVTFIARGRHLAAIRDGGLRIRSRIEGEYVVNATAATSAHGLAPFDAVLLTVKANDTESALEMARPGLRPDTPVLSLQNGVKSPAVIESVLGPGHAVGGAAYVFATIEAPGVVSHGLLGRIAFGELDGRRTPRVERLLAAFERAQIPAELSADIRRVMWEKYLFICAQAGMTALARVPAGVLRTHEATWGMYHALLEEAAAVAKAEGITLAPDVVENGMKAAAALAPGAFSSLHHDLVNGKPLELDALHGHLVRRGRHHGVPTPMAFAVYAALLPHAAGATA